MGIEYSILFTDTAAKDWKKIPSVFHSSLRRNIEKAKSEPYKCSEKLTNHHTFERRIKSGEYRVFISIDDTRKTVTIMAIKNRQQAYY